jgi:prophage tail gpP-like protein|tara:strand:+ start:27 stop:365 length:339 start_codon:yes stop_codon:yes gene_type:complete
MSSDNRLQSILEKRRAADKASSSTEIKTSLSRRSAKSKVKEEKKEVKGTKKTDKRSYKLDKIKAVTAKAYGVAAKRKWLVFLIGIGLIAYLVISSGGLGGLGGVVEKVKSFF